MTETKMTTKDPGGYPRRILLMVTGRTPQVVTETLYGLCTRSGTPFVPTEVHLITTAEGAQDARLALLVPATGWFHRLCADYRLSGIAFDPERIHVIHDHAGRPVEDIRTQVEHEACADLITEKVRGEGARLHRRPRCRPARLPGRRAQESRFETLEDGAASFTEVVSAIQKALEPPAVTVDYRAGGLHLADGRFVALSGADLAFYAWLARRRMASAVPVRIPGKDQRRWKPAAREEYAGYLREYDKETQRTDIRDGTGTELRAVGAMTERFFHQRRASIREHLEQAVGPLASAYAIAALTQGRPAGYGLAIAPERIEIVGDGVV